MRKNIELVQMLRGLAALLVCLFHMKGLLPDDKLGARLFGNGSIGVPLFFMISGFIMYHTTWQKQKPDWAYIIQFAKKRLVRVVPLYYLCTVIAISIFEQWPFYLFEHPERLLAGVLFMPSFHIMLGPSYGLPPLAVGWSLNYEMYFYLLLTLAMLLPAARWYALGSFILVCVFLVPWLQFGYLNSSMAASYRFSTNYFNLMSNPVMLFFLAGILAGAGYEKIPLKVSTKLANILLGIALTVFFLHFARVGMNISGYSASLISCGFLLIACLVRDKAGPVRIPEFLLFTGDVSYSMYLIHPLVLSGIPVLAGIAGLPIRGQGWLYFLFILVLILIVSHFSYRYIEQALGKWLMNFQLRSRVTGQAPD